MRAFWARFFCRVVELIAFWTVFVYFGVFYAENRLFYIILMTVFVAILIIRTLYLMVGLVGYLMYLRPRRNRG